MPLVNATDPVKSDMGRYTYDLESISDKLHMKTSKFQMELQVLNSSRGFISKWAVFETTAINQLW